MKTTLELPDDLYRQVKAKAALDGCRVTDVVVQGLMLALARPAGGLKRVEFPLIPADPSLPVITPGQVNAAEENTLTAEAHAVSLRR